MYNNDSYYEPEDDNSLDALQEQIYDLVNKDPDFNPANLSKMGEAIQQGYQDQELQDFIQDCVDKKDWAKLGLKLYMTSWDYQETCAEWHLTQEQ